MRFGWLVVGSVTVYAFEQLCFGASGLDFNTGFIDSGVSNNTGFVVFVTFVTKVLEFG